MTREELGYVLLDRRTLQRAEERAQAEASSAVVSRAVKQARARANDTVVEPVQIGKLLLDYVFAPAL